MTVYQIAKMVGDIRPGQSFEISRMEMNDVACLPGFRPPDMVMENIVGSAYEFSYYQKHNGNVVFYRRLKLTEGEFRTYVSPDRRDRFKQLPNGLWEPKNNSRQSG